MIWLLAGLLLVANQAGCHSVAPANRTTNKGSLPVEEYHWNCGLNTGYITLRLFRKDVDIIELADEIKAGPYLKRSVSLLNLKKAFEK